MQKITQHKCMKYKLSYVTSFYDSSTAFYCCSHDSVEDYRCDTHGELGRNSLNQVVGNNITIRRTAEGLVLLSPATGVAPGLHNATNMFNHSYNKALQEYYRNCADDTSMMFVKSPFNDEKSK